MADKRGLVTNALGDMLGWVRQLMQAETFSTGRGPTAPTGTKLDILRLLMTQELSAQQLGERLQVSPAAIRQHLEALAARGLVARRKLVTRPSRPTFLYRLSPDGRRVFPKRYDLLLGDLLETLVERQGWRAVSRLLEAAAVRLAARVRSAATPTRARLEPPFERLEAELDWRADLARDAGGRRHVTIHHCPFQEVAAARPEVCGVFFSALLGALYGGARVEPVAASDLACCRFVVRPRRKPERRG